MPPKKEEAHKWSWGKISAIIGSVASLIAILTFAGQYIVTGDELKLAEQRIIQKIEHEAVKTRTVYVSELLERKGALEKELENDKLTEQEFKNIERKIDKLDKRIDKLRGK